jgi:hypothetical protein
MTNEKLDAALKTLEQALREVSHAQDRGAEWYTKGSSGLYQQVRMWVNKGFDAIREARAAAEPGDGDSFPQRDRAIEILRCERDGAMAQRDWYIKLLAKFWRITPPDVKAPDGRTFQFVDPDPQRSLRIIRECMEEAERQMQAEATPAKSEGGQP